VKLYPSFARTRSSFGRAEGSAWMGGECVREVELVVEGAEPEGTEYGWEGRGRKACAWLDVGNFLNFALILHIKSQTKISGRERLRRTR